VTPRPASSGRGADRPGRKVDPTFPNPPTVIPVSKLRSLLVALAGTLCVFPASAVAKAPERLTLTSAPVRGHAVKGRVLGPFTLRNTTRVAYDVATFPVLLTQSRDGGLSVRDDARARRAAARKLAVPTPRFRLEPGRARSMPAAVVQAPAAQGLYAGILFASRPDTAAPTGGGTQLINVPRVASTSRCRS
jgi:hypothetical protein